MRRQLMNRLASADHLSSAAPCMGGGASGQVQRGFTLLEVLIAVLVLSIGLLGVMALQANMLSYSHSAYLTSLASVKALDLEERMRANRGVAEDYVFGDGQLSSMADDNAGLCDECTEDQLKEYDQAVWSQSVLDLFPSNVDADLEEDDGVYTLNIRWVERERSLESADSDEIDFSYSFRL